MECEAVLKKICDELAEDIHSELCERIRQHLQQCPACAQKLYAMRRTVELFRCLNEQSVPPPIHDRLMRLLNLSEHSAQKSWHQ